MFEAGTLVLLPFPSSDATTSKRWPVLALVTPDEYGDFIGMAMSSRSHHADTVPSQNNSLVEGRLPKPSWIRIDRGVTLSTSLAAKAFAKTKAEILRQAIGGQCEMLRKQIFQA